MGMAGALVSTIQDKVFTTGDSGHIFLKLDSGMTDVLRPSLYGAIHPMTILPGTGKTEDIGSETEDVIVVGHCCESGDLMTPKPGEPEDLAERCLRKAEIGDLLVMDGSGAYCAGMSTKNYNSFPEAPEVMVDFEGKPHIIRHRQPEVTQEESYDHCEIIRKEKIKNKRRCRRPTKEEKESEVCETSSDGQDFYGWYNKRDKFKCCYDEEIIKVKEKIDPKCEPIIIETVTDGMPVWVIQNSWGTGWGDSGFARIEATDGNGVCYMNYWTQAVTAQ